MNLINCDMRKYTGLTQPESASHLKMSSVLHCLGLYSDPSDINFVHVHQNAIRNAFPFPVMGLPCPTPTQGDSSVVDRWSLSVTGKEAFAYMERWLGGKQGI